MTRRQLLLAAPLGGAVLAGAAFWDMLHRMNEGKFNPHVLPSPLIGKTIPKFTLPAQPPSTAGFTSAELLAAPRPLLINFFASWCVPCLQESPELLRLKQAGFPIWGIAYKDQSAAAEGFIARHGNPYVRIAADTAGLTAINFGLYGVPETYLLDRQGIVRWRWPGAITREVATRVLDPLWHRYA